MIISEPDPNRQVKSDPYPDPTSQVITDPDSDRYKVSDPVGSRSAKLHKIHIRVYGMLCTGTVPIVSADSKMITFGLDKGRIRH